MRKLHFIGGLPRSGSTMLAAILNQNPKFHVGITCPSLSLVSFLDTHVSRNPEVQTQLNEDDRRRYCKSLILGHYSVVDEEKTVFVSHRASATLFPRLNDAFGEVKLVAMVRSPAWVFDSFERYRYKYPTRTPSFLPAGQTQVEAFESMIRPNGIIGMPLHEVHSIYLGPLSHQMMLIEYEAFCAAPGQCMEAIYKFLDEELYEHDFDNFTYSASQFDTALDAPDLHTVSGPIKNVARTTILPPRLFDQASSMMFWHGPSQSQSPKIVRKRAGKSSSANSRIGAGQSVQADAQDPGLSEVAAAYRALSHTSDEG